MANEKEPAPKEDPVYEANAPKPDEFGFGADSYIKAYHLTKDYGKGRGNFDISFEVKPNEAFGLVGENGAGKTTLLRQMMGFIKPTSGKLTLFGLDAQKDADRLKALIGYVPGEINFPDLPSGTAFLKAQAEMMHVTDMKKADSIIKRLQLDIRAYPRRMSKGMKQKTAIVTALMAKKPLVLLDEPTTGLDPLMREEFLAIMNEEKKAGTTIVMSSNTMSELEAVCDRVALITKGHLVQIADVNAIKNRPFRDYKIEFLDVADYEAFIKGRKDIRRLQPQYHQATIRIDKSQDKALFEELSHAKLKFFSELNYDLTTYFQETAKGVK